MFTANFQPFNVTPVDDDDDWMSQKEMIHRQSHLRNFQEFFLRANKYPCLSLGGCKDEQHGKIVVVEVNQLYSCSSTRKLRMFPIK